jgi:hypothetical protein
MLEPTARQRVSTAIRSLTETETITAKSFGLKHLRRLSAREDTIEFCRRYIFKTYRVIFISLSLFCGEEHHSRCYGRTTAV